MNALGLIEVYGYLGAIEAADSALKAANVKLIDCEKVRGGLVCVKLTGDVGAIKAAVDVAEEKTKNLNVYVSSHVIAKPDDSLKKILEISKKIKTESKKEIIKEEKSEVSKIETDNKIIFTKEELELKTVEELRRMVRNIKSSMSNKQIKYARKDKLIEELSRYYKRGNK
jgi:energy-coupling factor transport system substrate-specific component